MAGCGCKAGLTDEQVTILKAVESMGSPCASKDIASATGLDNKAVSCRLTSLKKKGYIASPARCRYEITAEGKSQL